MADNDKELDVPAAVNRDRAILSVFTCLRMYLILDFASEANANSQSMRVTQWAHVPTSVAG